jgi:hypothetical protein
VGTTRYSSSPGECCFPCSDRTLDKSHRCRSAALSTYLIKTRTCPLVKARG